MRKIYVFSLLLTFFSSAFAQTITIGPAQFVIATNVYGPMRSNVASQTSSSPQGPSWNRHAYVYPQTLLTPMPSGATITSLEFLRSISTTGTNIQGNLAGNPTLKIYLKNLATGVDFGASSITWSTEIGTATLVYNGDPTTIVGTTSGYKQFPSASTFNYTGGALAVYVEYVQSVATVNDVLWVYDNPTGVPAYTANQVRYANESATVTTPANILSTSNARHPHVKVNYSFSTPVNAALTLLGAPITCTNPMTASVVLLNDGTSAIAAGAATITLKVDQSNTLTATQTNSTTLAPGASTTINFTGLNLPNLGKNGFTAYVDLASDPIRANDTVRALGGTLTSRTFPYVENFETTTANEWLLFRQNGLAAVNFEILSSISYPDLLPSPVVLAPKDGSKCLGFRSYDFAFGSSAVAYLPCVSVPTNTPGCGSVFGFYAAQDGQYSDADSLYVFASTDGGNNFNIIGRIGRYDSSLARSGVAADRAASRPNWKLFTYGLDAFQGQSLQLAILASGAFGNSMGIDSAFINLKSANNNVALANAATNATNLIKSCDESGWTYYSKPSNGTEYLFAVNWDPNNNGANASAKSTATASIIVDRTYFKAEDVPSKQATYTMKRYWDVNLNGSTINPANPVKVRFFYAQSELDSLVNAKNAFLTANAGLDEGIVWFKTISGAFIPSLTSVNAGGVNNAIGLANANTSGNKINGQLYAEFSGVTSFSGGTLAAGVGPNSPLPISLLSFTGIKQDKTNLLNWSTASETNNRGFELQRSANGNDFTSITFVNSKAIGGNSSAQLNYSFSDITPLGGTNYYRLKQVDKDGKFSMSKVVAIKGLKPTSLQLVGVYPNPAVNKLNVNIESPVVDFVTLVVTDMTGKVLMNKMKAMAVGDNNVELNVSTLPAGSYFIKAVCANGCETSTAKFVKQ
jgi:Secretion system C-terminal sorting domain